MGIYVGLCRIGDGKYAGEPTKYGADKWTGRDKLLELCYSSGIEHTIMVKDIVDWPEHYYRPLDFAEWREKLKSFEDNGELFTEMVDAMEADETLWVHCQ